MLPDSNITRYPNNPSHPLGNYIEGQRIGDIYGYETIGIAKSQEEQIFIEYMYAFAQADQAHVVIKPNDMSQCLKVLEAHHCHVLAKEEL